MDKRLKAALQAGQKSQRVAKQKEALTFAAEQQRAREYHARRLAEVKNEWVDNGRLFTEIRRAVKNSEDCLVLGGPYGGMADCEMAEVFNKIDGIKAVHTVEEERVDDDGPMCDIEYIKVTWSK